MRGDARRRRGRAIRAREQGRAPRRSSPPRRRAMADKVALVPPVTARGRSRTSINHMLDLHGPARVVAVPLHGPPVRSATRATALDAAEARKEGGMDAVKQRAGRRAAVTSGPLAGLRVLDLGTRIAAPFCAGPARRAGRRGHQDRAARQRRLHARDRPVRRRRRRRELLAVLGGRGPGPQERHPRPAHARGPGPVPPPGRDRRRRRRELPARHARAVEHRPRRPRPEARRRAHLDLRPGRPLLAAARPRPRRHRLRRPAAPHRLPRPAAGARRRHDLRLPHRRVRRARRARRALRARRPAHGPGRGDRRRALRRGPPHPRVDARPPTTGSASSAAARATACANSAPLDNYPTADGKYVCIVAGSDANFARLCTAMDRPDLLDDPRFTTLADRAAHGDEINGIVAEWTSTLDRRRDRGALRRRRRPGRHRLHRGRHLRRPPHRRPRRPRHRRRPGRRPAAPAGAVPPPCRRARRRAHGRRPASASTPTRSWRLARPSTPTSSPRSPHDGVDRDAATAAGARRACSTRTSDGSIALVGGYSPSCGRHPLPAASACPYTGADDVERGRAVRRRHAVGLDRGHRPRRPATTATSRTASAWSSCPTGLRVDHPARPRPTPTRLEFGQPMHLVADALQTDDDGTAVVTYAFAPAAGAVSETVGDRRDRHAPVRALRRTVTVTDMGVTAVASRARRGRRTRSSRPRSAAPRTAASPSGHKVLGALGLHRHADRRRRGRAARAAAPRSARGRRRSRAGQYDTRARVRRREDAQGDHPLVVLRAVARGGRARRHARLLRAARPAADARVGRHQGPPRRGRREEPRATASTTRTRCSASRRHGRGRARVAASSASRCTSGCCARPTRARPRSCCAAHRRRRPVGRHARRRRAALAPARARCSARPRRWRASTTPTITPPIDARRRRRLRRGRRRARRPRRRRVPGHRRRPRAARLPGARALCAGRAGRCSPTADATVGGRRPGQPERRPALEGRAARRVGARPGRRARRTSSAAPPAPARSTARASASPHTVGRGANAAVVILTR